MHSRFRLSLAVLLTPVLLLSGAACEPSLPGERPGTTISEDAFVEAVVALRRAAIENSSGRLDPQQTRDILSDQGTTEEELRRFVEIRGGNAPTMSSVWTRIEARLTGQDPQELQLDSADIDTLPGVNPDAPEPGAPSVDAEASGGSPGPSSGAGAVSSLRGVRAVGS